MLFWLIASTIAAVSTLATVLPLLTRPKRDVTARAAYDEEVYRAQLRELTEDEARGAVGRDEAAASRAEIGRRLLRARDAAVETSTVQPSRHAAMRAGLAVTLLLPIGAFLFYDRWGSPELPDQPLAARPAPEAVPDVPTMIAQIEDRLAAEPNDGAGWSVVAPVYLQLGESEKAVAAFRNALRLTAPTAQKVAGLGEALVQASDGTVTPEARAQFTRALGLDPNWVPARFFLALALSQEGRPAEAVEAWGELLRTGPSDGPWRPVAEAALADARSAMSATPAPGPTQADVEAAQDLAEPDRQAMIQGMVSGLAERLEAQPDDPDGWKRLMRSYVVLGQEHEARAALVRARAAFPASSPVHMDIVAFARTLGLEPDTKTQ